MRRIRVLGTDVIEGNLAYLEKEKDNNITIVAVGGFRDTVGIDKLTDFLKNTRLDKDVKEELKVLIDESILDGSEDVIR